jgi:hypothetical protein
MNFRILTVAREYGSGGAEIAGIIANQLGWRLMDQALLSEISERAQAPIGEVVAKDERVDPWLYRIMRPIWGKGADGFSAIAPVNLFDADAAAVLAKLVIQEAHCVGRCVIVGRGAQGVLRGKRDVFNVFVYAAWSERARRIQGRVASGTNVDELIHSMDASRLEYVRHYHGLNRLDPHLYNLMIDSKNQPELAARLILSAMEMPW